MGFYQLEFIAIKSRDTFFVGIFAFDRRSRHWYCCTSGGGGRMSKGRRGEDRERTTRQRLGELSKDGPFISLLSSLCPWDRICYGINIGSDRGSSYLPCSPRWSDFRRRCRQRQKSKSGSLLVQCYSLVNILSLKASQSHGPGVSGILGNRIAADK